MIKKRRGQKKNNPDGSSWLTTYSDMVTLLMAFFVLMLSFSTVDAAQFDRTMVSLQEALGVLQSGRTIVVDDSRDLDLSESEQDVHEQASQISQLLRVRSQIGSELDEQGFDDHTKFRLTERGLILQFTDQVLFPSGSADLRSEALEVLDALAPNLESIPNQIRVEGHTDNVPIDTPRFPSNWELSTARATNILRHLLGVAEIDSNRMSAAGYGEYRPLAENTTAEGRAQNRRVDIVLLRLGAAQFEPN